MSPGRKAISIAGKQRGVAMMIFVLLLVMGGLTYLLSGLSSEGFSSRRERQTQEALAQAREALIGYALRYREDQIAQGQPDRVYGYLPLPDLGTTRNNNAGCSMEGCDAANFAGNAVNTTVIGRLPWRALGLPPLRDSDGECLWLAVSGSHQRIQRFTPMNWDTLGQLDLVTANGSNALASALSAHDRPIAVVFSPGPVLTGQNRAAPSPATDDVTECGGNYDARNYLDQANAVVTNFLAGTNAANAVTGDSDLSNDPDVPKALSVQGKIMTTGGNYWPRACPVDGCVTVADDLGLALTNDDLFGALRKSSLFRADINALLDRTASCLRDEIIAAGGTLSPPYADIAGADDNSCYGRDVDPLGYYPNYRKMISVAAPAGGVTVTVDGGAQPSCRGALIFSGERGSAQTRSTAASRNSPANYLEGENLASFGAGTTFAGPSLFARVSSSHPAEQDIVRCIPSTASFVPAPSALPPGAELSQYDPATRTLTLGRPGVESDQGYSANALFGCIWTPEVRATGSGFRSYFKFRIDDAGDGFVFAAVDGELNGTNACGAGDQHLGYSGDNGFAGVTAPIAAPKIGLEVDTRRNFVPRPPFLPNGFDPSTSGPLAFRTLANGRADPGYAGGHIGLVYWGGDALVSTSDGVLNMCTVNSDCLSPSTCDAGICKLSQVEDDNVHGQLPVQPAERPAPQNPAAPVTPPTDPAYPPFAVDKLDPSLSSVPTNDIHMRVEVARSGYSGRDDNSRLVRVVSNANLATLSGLPIIDSIALQAGDSVLVIGQVAAKNNGVYVASAGAWTRAGSANDSADLPPGSSWFIKEGAVFRGSLWRLQNLEAPVVDVSDLVITQFRQPVRAVATTNLLLTGLQNVGGVLLADGDRVLLTGQNDPRQNGVYGASAGNWNRAALESTAAGLKDGATWFVTSGGSGYWHLNGDATPGTSNIAITPLSFPSNDIYSSVITTQVWKATSNTGQIARMKLVTRSMNQLDPVVRHGTCAPSAPRCPTANPAGQYCGGIETDGLRYCYTGQQPKLYDSKKVFDIRGTTSCASNASCPGNQFCGIDLVCYQPALRTTRLGFTNSQSTQSQQIRISDFFTIFPQ